MNARKARHRSRRMFMLETSGPRIQAPRDQPFWIAPPSRSVTHLLLSACALRFAIQHNEFMDEPPPEPERFSGGLNLSAGQRNLERLRYQIAPAARTIYCGKYTLAFIRSRLRRA